MLYPRVIAGAIQEHLRIGDLAGGAVPERTHLQVEVGADPAHLRLRDPGKSISSALTRSSTLGVDTPYR